MNTRLTTKEEEAIRHALAFVLAGGDEMEETFGADVVQAMFSAQEKMQARSSAK